MAGSVVLLDKYNRGLSGFFDENGNLDFSSMESGKYVTIGGIRIYNFTTAITEGETATSAPAGSFAFTSHATGNNKIFRSDGSLWQAASGALTGVQYAEATISAADIVSTSAGKLGHANGYPLVAAPGAGYAIEFRSAVIILDFGVAAYADGGNVTVNYAGGGAAVSAAVSAANSIGGAADKVAVVQAAVPTNNQLAANTGLNLVAASAFTNPGTATGVVRVKVRYAVHATGL
ncbi:MAG TPA: hypothetical protein VN256_13190 [Pyrinomonadaceae bacterium]|nr:hypothetical protein [Pyrinomonadaceae bacterium]